MKGAFHHLFVANWTLPANGYVCWLKNPDVQGDMWSNANPWQAFFDRTAQTPRFCGRCFFTLISLRSPLRWDFNKLILFICAVLPFEWFICAIVHIVGMKERECHIFMPLIFQLHTGRDGGCWLNLKWSPCAIYEFVAHLHTGTLFLLRCGSQQKWSNVDNRAQLETYPDIHTWQSSAAVQFDLLLLLCYRTHITTSKNPAIRSRTPPGAGSCHTYFWVISHFPAVKGREIHVSEANPCLRGIKLWSFWQVSTPEIMQLHKRRASVKPAVQKAWPEKWKFWKCAQMRPGKRKNLNARLAAWEQSTQIHHK